MSTRPYNASDGAALRTGVPFTALTEATRTAGDVASNAVMAAARALGSFVASSYREYQVRRTMAALAKLEGWVLRDIGVERSGLREAAEAAVDGVRRHRRSA